MKNEFSNDLRAFQLQNKFIAALAKATTSSPVTLNALQKIAGPAFKGTQILDQLLKQLSEAKAISNSTGMKEGDRFVSYWPTANFAEFTKQISNRSARQFTVAEKGLIKKVHGFMPAQQLLDILNERLVCDIGPDAVLYSMEQLHAEIGDTTAAAPTGGYDWPSLRKLIAKAERDGVIDAINEQVINDFAVVFSLNQKQVLTLKDIILQAKEDA